MYRRANDKRIDKARATGAKIRLDEVASLRLDYQIGLFNTKRGLWHLCQGLLENRLKNGRLCKDKPVGI